MNGQIVLSSANPGFAELSTDELNAFLSIVGTVLSGGTTEEIQLADAPIYESLLTKGWLISDATGTKLTSKLSDILLNTEFVLALPADVETEKQQAESFDKDFEPAAGTSPANTTPPAAPSPSTPASTPSETTPTPAATEPGTSAPSSAPAENAPTAAAPAESIPAETTSPATDPNAPAAASTSPTSSTGTGTASEAPAATPGQ